MGSGDETNFTAVVYVIVHGLRKYPTPVTSLVLSHGHIFSVYELTKDITVAEIEGLSSRCRRLEGMVMYVDIKILNVTKNSTNIQ